MAEKGKLVKIILIFALVIIITFFQYFTRVSEHRHHMFYEGLFFLPIMLAGFWFGLSSSLATSLSITSLLLPFTFLYWKGFSAYDFNNVMELVLYNVVAVILGILKDRERKEQEHRQEAERLATMGQSVSGLAHDMRTGLVAIGGFSRLLRKRPSCVNACGEKLDMIIDEAQRLEGMTENMLDFARPLELHCSTEDVNQIVSQSLALLLERAQTKKVEIQSKITLNPPHVFLDHLRLKQVLINLLLNAIEASPEGETVKLEIYHKRKNLVINVRDNGCGLPSGKKERIFFPFFTTKSKGTGLGLPIAKKIIEAHRGRLEVIENPGRGVTFSIVIPLEKFPFSQGADV